MISILIPHLREQRSDDAFKICLECIVDNTDVDYEVMIKAVAGSQGVYRAYMTMAERACGEWLLIHNNDMFLAPGWARPMLDVAQLDTIVSGVLVECGAICPANENVRMDFGMLPETFRRKEFEAWVAKNQPWPGRPGHHALVIVHRETFLNYGGYDLSLGEYPHVCLDQELWGRWGKSGNQFARVRSYCYHLQQWSNPIEQTKKSRIPCESTS